MLSPESAEVPRVEVPRVEVPRAEVPRVEVPRAEVPRAEVPRVEVPRVEVPRAEVPRVEVPRAEVSRAEVPRAEVPRVEVPRAEVPRAGRMKVQWTKLGLVVFFLHSCVMTGCFVWQYRTSKLQPAEEVTEAEEKLCPRFPEPTPLQHPIPALKDAFQKIDALLRSCIHDSRLPAMSAIVVYNDSVLWNGHFGKVNSSDPTSPSPNEYTVYRIASVSKLFPTLMLYRLWEEGLVGSLDDPLEKYAENFTIKNPLGPGSASLTLRRMAGQLSGLPRKLRSTSLLWDGDTQSAMGLLKDDVLVAEPGTRCHYSNVAFSLLAHVLARRVADQDYERWVSEHLLARLGMQDTGFTLGPAVRRRMAVGVYGTGQSAPLYDLGWYRPAGQMYSTPADLSRLAMALLGASRRPLLRPDTLKTMLTPLFRCHDGYFANATGTPWEVNELLGYEVLKKDGDLDGYAATFSLVPRLKLGLVLLMAGVRPGGRDLLTQAYAHLIPALESAFRDARRSVTPPPDPAPYVGVFTYKNMTFYEIRAGEKDGVLVMQQFGPQVDAAVPSEYRSLRLDFLEERVFRVVFPSRYPCRLKVNSASVSLEAQDRQLFNFYVFDKKGLSPGFDSPGLNTYRVTRIASRPIFPSI